jgi:hypothetical protein
VWACASSLVLGLIGVLATRAGVARLARSRGRDPHVYWAIGLVSLVPAWVVAFLSLLGSAPREHLQAVTGAAWILSAAAALVGAISTERRVRDASEASEPDPVRGNDRPDPGCLVHELSPERSWRIGVLTFVPAWAIALAGHLLRRAGG